MTQHSPERSVLGLFGLRVHMEGIIAEAGGGRRPVAPRGGQIRMGTNRGISGPSIAQIKNSSSMAPVPPFVLRIIIELTAAVSRIIVGLVDTRLNGSVSHSTPHRGRVSAHGDLPFVFLLPK